MTVIFHQHLRSVSGMATARWAALLYCCYYSSCQLYLWCYYSYVSQCN